MTTAINVSFNAAGLRQLAATLGRVWPTGLFVVCTLTTLACLGWISWQGAPPGAGRVPAGAVAPGEAAFPAEWQRVPGGREAHAAIATGARPLPPVPESEWQRQRADALAIERLNNEMMPLTPGVSPEQYVDGSDDLGPDAAQAEAGDQGDDDDDAASQDDD